MTTRHTNLLDFVRNTGWHLIVRKSQPRDEGERTPKGSTGMVKMIPNPPILAGSKWAKSITPQNNRANQERREKWFLYGFSPNKDERSLLYIHRTQSTHEFQELFDTLPYHASNKIQEQPSSSSIPHFSNPISVCLAQLIKLAHA